MRYAKLAIERDQSPYLNTYSNIASNNFISGSLNAANTVIASKTAWNKYDVPIQFAVAKYKPQTLEDSSEIHVISALVMQNTVFENFVASEGSVLPIADLNAQCLEELFIKLDLHGALFELEDGLEESKIKKVTSEETERAITENLKLKNEVKHLKEKINHLSELFTRALGHAQI